MNILFTICGRAGSKGLRNKNLKNFLGFPLPFYTVSIIDLYIKKNVQHDCDVVLNTDSKDLIDLFKEKIAMDIYTIERTPDLSKDLTPKVEVIKNCYFIMKDRLGKEYDVIVDLDMTSPLRTLIDLENLIEKKLISNSDVVYSVTKSRRNPYFNMVIKTENGYERVIKSNFNTRQQAPEIFDMNASLYAYSPKFLKSEKGIFESKCDAIKMLDTAVLDIDSEEDFELMQVIAGFLFKTKKEFSFIVNNIKEIEA